MFYVAYLLPYEVHWAGRWWQLPDWLKVALGLALPAIGYVSEIVRGAVRAVPVGQWEAARALGLRHGQALRYVIIPVATSIAVTPIKIFRPKPCNSAGAHCHSNSNGSGSIG